MKLLSNWRIYQVRIDGKDKLVGDLTMDELRLALCQAIDALEDADAAVAAAAERIESWRSGKGVSSKRSVAEQKPRRVRKS